MSTATMSREQKAEQIASTAASWPRITVRGVREAWAVPSQSEPGKFHVTSRFNCDCWAWAHGKRCAHVAAVGILLDQQRARAATPAPVSLDAERTRRLAEQYDSLVATWGDAA